MPIVRPFLLLALLITCGCSTIIEGRTQQITVKSAPDGAQCVLKQADEVVGRITTPGTAIVSKTKNDLVILCSKDGYESVSFRNHSDLALATFGNSVFYQLSFLGNAIDSASGASNKYDSDVFVTLAPADTPMAFPIPPGMPPVVKLSEQTTAMMSMQAPMPTQQVSAPVIPVSTQDLTPAAAAPALVRSGPNPSLEASSLMGKAALTSYAQQQPGQMTYAQAVADSARRPPFDMAQ